MEDDEQMIVEYRGHRLGITFCRRVNEMYVRVDVWRNGAWDNRAALRVGEAEDKFRRGIDWALRYAREHEAGH